MTLRDIGTYTIQAEGEDSDETVLIHRLHESSQQYTNV